MDIQIAKQSTDLVARATGLRVVDQESLSLANELLLTGKQFVKKIKDFFAPLKQDAHASWKGICDTENEELAKLMPTIMTLDRSIVNYRVEQDRIRREAEEKARRQEEERRRLEEEAFRRAQEKERQAREATERAAREQNAAARKKAQEEAARAQAEADKIIAKAAAEEKKLEPAIVIPEKVVTTGTAIRHNWKFRLVNFKDVPDEYKILNEVLVGKIGRASEGKAKILGIDFYDEPSTMNTR
jgi:flagellar biosynthesis GTPase FlhF